MAIYVSLPLLSFKGWDVSYFPKLLLLHCNQDRPTELIKRIKNMNTFATAKYIFIS